MYVDKDSLKAPEYLEQLRKSALEYRTRAISEAEAKEKAREQWLANYTCKCCGQHPPIPVSLL